MKPIWVFASILLFIATGTAQKTFTAAEAKGHIGESATVCGEVASIHFAPTTRGRPTFLNLDEPYPNQIFTALIWGSDRAKFDVPEEHFRNKRVCVSGTIAEYRGSPEIVLYQPSQIHIEERPK
jgi:DNA/RNA endonuclease YhcR with UshA esterase domain